MVKKKANVERSRAEFEAELHLLSIKNAVTWLYGVKLYPINQSYYKKEAATTEVELRVLQEEGSQLDALSDAVLLYVDQSILHLDWLNLLSVDQSIYTASRLAQSTICRCIVHCNWLHYL